jgi:ATP-binding cassette subfamily F protein 3
MIQIVKLFHGYAGKFLYNNASIAFKPQRKVALVGNNGTGKTTLFRLITGEEEAQKGDVLVPKNYRIEYLAQELESQSERSIIDECMSAFSDTFLLEAELQELHIKLATDSTNANLISAIERKQNELAHVDVFRLEAEAKKVLAGLGFKDAEFTRSLQSFSGGWQMRVHLAKMLLRKPDFLLLDEPTNHLDIESLTWLENYLKSYNHSVIIISHDRTFLDRIVDEVVELHQSQFERYVGNYSDFEASKEERLLLEEKAAAIHDHHVRHIQQFVDRFRYKATKSKQVQSRIKMLERLGEVTQTENSRHIQFSFAVSKASAKRVFVYEQLGKTYNENKVLSDLSGTIYKGERIALMGANGQGKSTFIKLLLNDISASHGSVLRGERVDVGYYSQHQLEQLNPKHSVMEEVALVASEERRLAIRSILGSFLFSGDDVNKKIAMLSGGEKARVALAKLLVQPVNTLILDEPTNHLDMQSKERLQMALTEFDGTLIIISHDRSFLDGLVEQVFYFFNGHYHVFKGEMVELDAWRSTFQLPKEIAAEKAPAAKLSYADLKKQKNLISKTEREIAVLQASLEKIEQDRETITAKMHSGESNVTKLMEWQAALDKLDEKELETFAAWEEKEAELLKLQDSTNN